uniref:Uncharacterized protein n=1 Tax=Anopheles quadriannulatus TaxID=34691 RepID=A0A182XS10_ANOQN
FFVLLFQHARRADLCRFVWEIVTNGSLERRTTQRRPCSCNITPPFSVPAHISFCPITAPERATTAPHPRSPSCVVAFSRACVCAW